MEDMTNLQLLFSFYSCTSPPLSSMALECLVRLLCSFGTAGCLKRAVVRHVYAKHIRQSSHVLTSHALLVRCDLHQSDDLSLQPRWSEPGSLLN